MINWQTNLAISKSGLRPLYVYSQAFGPEWVTVGAYVRAHDGESARFRYAPSYLERADWVSIDPVNLPAARFTETFVAPRYSGLHDVLRDVCPDSWGRNVLIKYRGLFDKSSSIEFLKATENTDRWGALAVGDKPVANPLQTKSLNIANVEHIVDELQAMEKGAAAINQKLRDQLARASIGGARPKATVKDKEGVYWLLKPQSMFDVPQTAQLEHFAQAWGAQSGMNFAHTELLQLPRGIPAVLVKRFDRENGYRKMCLSAASVLRCEFPMATPKNDESHAPVFPSYPRLASAMRVIGCLKEDLQELFRRMVFNAICGNDDDHLRNHALLFDMEKRQWRLSPAYDVVPSHYDTPKHLAIGVSQKDRRITPENILSGFAEFGFVDKSEAKRVMEETFEKVRQSYLVCKSLLDKNSQEIISRRIDCAEKVLFAHH